MTKIDESAADTEFDRRNARRCAPRNYPLLPEGVRGWFETLIVAKEAGVSFEEVRDRLEGTEEDEAFREWSAAVTASVMGYSSLPSKRTMN